MANGYQIDDKILTFLYDILFFTYIFDNIYFQALIFVQQIKSVRKDMAKNIKSDYSKKKITKDHNHKTSIAIKYGNKKQPWWPIFIALFVTFICFYNAIDNNFVNWDDDRNFYENPLVTNITKDNFWKNTKEIFSSDVIGNYNPLPIWTFAIEKLQFGFDNPAAWHLNNILLHLLCVFLVYQIVVLLGISWRGALLTALLFGIHPMRVESVAWITERKDVLFGAFYLAALLQYIKLKLDSKSIRWIWIIIFFTLSLFSKIQAVSLPISMLAIDYYLDGKWTFSDFKTRIFQKIPLFLLSLVFGILGLITLSLFGSLSIKEDITYFNFIQRIFLGAFSFIVYLVKSIIPYRLSPLYPYPASFPWYFYPSILIIPTAVYILYKSYINEKKAIFFGLVFFIVNIIFLLQILGAGQGYLADRFTYIGYLGLFFIAGFYFDNWLTKGIYKPVTLWSFSTIILFIYGLMTINQNKIWKNSETLWTHVLKYYTQTTLPYGNRANYFREQKMYDKALSDYASSLKIKEQQPQLYNSRGRLYFEVAKSKDTLLLALNDYNKAIEYLPEDGEFRINRGATYARLGDINKAIEDLNEGLKLKPDHAVGYLNRSIMHHNIGRVDLALEDIQSYLNINPSNGDLWYEKGRALNILNRPEEALVAYTEALKHPVSNAGKIIYERSQTYHKLDRINEARADFQNALKYDFNGINETYRKQLGF